MISTYQRNILILESNPARRDYLKSMMSGWNYTPFIFEKESICFDNLSSLAPSLVIAGSLSFEKTFRFINTLKVRKRDLPVLIISSDETVRDYVKNNGFTDVFIIKTPIEPSEIKRVVGRIKHANLESKIEQNVPLIIGNSPEIVKIKRIISELSSSKEPVLIQGETGTGKDLVARAIHYASDRRDKPLIKVNTAALRLDRFESELSGYRSDGFLNDDWDNRGVFEVADSGTIFLDEIAEMPASLQVKLLQILESEFISKPGSAIKEVEDVRIIVAANPDIGMLVETGKFRKDLYFRLNVINIEIPPLRNRAEDIILLAAFFNDKFCGEFGKSHYELSKKTMQMFMSYHWPENVRELKNVVKRAVSIGSESSIADELLLNDHQQKSMNFIDCCEDVYILSELLDIKKYLKDLSKISLKDICKEYVGRTEKKFMKKVLEKTNWNRKKAANLMDISYKSLLNKMKAYNLT